MDLTVLHCNSAPKQCRLTLNSVDPGEQSNLAAAAALILL